MGLVRVARAFLLVGILWGIPSWADARVLDFYEVLGVTRDISQSALKKAYYKLAVQYHPDKNPDDKVAAAKFQDIGEAWDTLGDEKLRESYDALWTQLGRAPTNEEWNPLGDLQHEHARNARHEAQITHVDNQANASHELNPLTTAFLEQIERTRLRQESLTGSPLLNDLAKSYSMDEKAFLGIINDTKLSPFDKGTAFSTFYTHQYTQLTRAANAFSAQDLYAAVTRLNTTTAALAGKLNEDYMSSGLSHAQAMSSFVAQARSEDPAFLKQLAELLDKGQPPSLPTWIIRKISGAQAPQLAVVQDIVMSDPPSFVRIVDHLAKEKNDKLLATLLNKAIETLERLSVKHLSDADLNDNDRTVVYHYLNALENAATQTNLKSSSKMAIAFLGKRSVNDLRKLVGIKIPVKEKIVVDFIARVQTESNRLSKGSEESFADPRSGAVAAIRNSFEAYWRLVNDPTVDVYDRELAWGTFSDAIKALGEHGLNRLRVHQLPAFIEGMTGTLELNLGENHEPYPNGFRQEARRLILEHRSTEVAQALLKTLIDKKDKDATPELLTYFRAFDDRTEDRITKQLVKDLPKSRVALSKLIKIWADDLLKHPSEDPRYRKSFELLQGTIELLPTDKSIANLAVSELNRVRKDFKKSDNTRHLANEIQVKTRAKMKGAGYTCVGIFLRI